MTLNKQIIHIFSFSFYQPNIEIICVISYFPLSSFLSFSLSFFLSFSVQIYLNLTISFFGHIISFFLHLYIPISASSFLSFVSSRLSILWILFFSFFLLFINYTSFVPKLIISPSMLFYISCRYYSTFFFPLSPVSSFLLSSLLLSSFAFQDVL